MISRMRALSNKLIRAPLNRSVEQSISFPIQSVDQSWKDQSTSLSVSPWIDRSVNRMIISCHFGMLTCTNQSNDRSPCPFIGSKSVNQSITYSINQSNLWLIVLSNSLSCEWSLNRSVCRNQSVNHQPIDKPIPVISVNASIVDHTVNQSISQTVSQSIIINHWSLIDRFLIVWIVVELANAWESLNQSVNQSVTSGSTSQLHYHSCPLFARSLIGMMSI